MHENMIFNPGSCECKCKQCHRTLKYDVPFYKARKILGHQTIEYCEDCFDANDGEQQFYKDIIRSKTSSLLKLDLDDLLTIDLDMIIECIDIDKTANELYHSYKSFISEHQEVSR